jgi:hypothetical protein
VAQVGGSPAIAPHAPTAAVQGRSPLFNWANGLWDHGQLGAFNSIVVGDLDPQINATGKVEVYVASTTGIRKFFVP